MRGSGQKPALRVRGFNKENAQAMVEYRKSIGKMGGRPKGVLNKATIAKIKTKETFDAAILDRLGIIGDDLLRNSQNGDTQAAKVLLEHVLGKPKDNSLRDNIETVFSLIAFAQRAAQLPLDVTKDVTVPTLPHPAPLSEE